MLEEFIAQAVASVRGGIAPLKKFPTDLRRVIKAAGANQADVERRVLRQLLPEPGTAKAPDVFWTTYRARLIELAEEPLTRQFLFEMIPTEVEPDIWFDLLLNIGFADALRAHPNPISWIERFVNGRWRYAYYGTLSRLVRTLPLRGKHIHLEHPATPELCDALLEAGVHVDATILPEWFIGWSRHDDAPELTFLAAHPDVARCIPDVINAVQHVPEALMNREGTRRLLAMWLENTLGERATALTALANLRLIRPLCTKAGREALAEPFARALRSLNSANLLARSLRDGLVTEYCWPELEATVADLQREFPGAEVTCHESWPCVGVAAQGHVVWVDGARRVAEARFDPQHGTGHQRWRYLLIDGVTGCAWESGPLLKLTWSHDPDTSYQIQKSDPQPRWSFEVPQGRLMGHQVVHIGQDSNPFLTERVVLCEGSRFWDSATRREISLVTGRSKEQSWPPGIAALLATHGPQEGITKASWAPVTPTTAKSCLPTGGGVHGWVETWRRHAWSRYLLPNGQVVEGPKFMAGLIHKPGGGHWFIDANGDLRRDDGQPLLTANDEFGQPALWHRVPLNGWHQFQVRDPMVSARLRAATPDQLTQILDTSPVAEVQQGQFARWPSRKEPLSNEAKEAAAAFLGTNDEAMVSSVVWLATRVKSIAALARNLLAGEESR